jgi:hypothetical protein
MLALRVGERMPASDAVPLLQASAAAGCRGVLGDKHRMAAVGSLFSVANRKGGCKPLSDEAIGMLQHCLESPLFQIVSVTAGQMETLPER